MGLQLLLQLLLLVLETEQLLVQLVHPVGQLLPLLKQALLLSGFLFLPAGSLIKAGFRLLHLVHGIVNQLPQPGNLLVLTVDDGLGVAGASGQSPGFLLQLPDLLVDAGYIFQYKAVLLL